MLIGVVKCCYVPSIAVALPMITQYTTKKNSDMFVGCGGLSPFFVVVFVLFDLQIKRSVLLYSKYTTNKQITHNKHSNK